MPRLQPYAWWLWRRRCATWPAPGVLHYHSCRECTWAMITPGQSKGHAYTHLHGKPRLGVPHYGSLTSVSRRGDVQDYTAEGRRTLEGPTGGAPPSTARFAQS